MNSSNIVEMIQGCRASQDVKSIGIDVLRHRAMITYEAEEKTTETIVQKIFDKLPVP